MRPKKKAVDVTPVERFVQAILRVPKVAVNEAEAHQVVSNEACL